jgi:hypothetical protein
LGAGAVLREAAAFAILCSTEDDAGCQSSPYNATSLTVPESLLVRADEVIE